MSQPLAKLIDDAIEARADCLRLEVLAQIKIAREYRAAQDRGEVAQAGDNQFISESKVVRDLDHLDEDTLRPTIADLGLDKRRLSEWQKLADAGEDVVTQAITDALDAGREPTKADVTRAMA